MSNQDESDDDSEPDLKVNEVSQTDEIPEAMSRQTSPDEGSGPLVELDENGYPMVIIEAYNASNTLAVRSGSSVSTTARRDPRHKS